MLKNISNLFYDEKRWRELRQFSLFTSEAQLLKYQELFAKKLRSCSHKKTETIILTSSGSTNNEIKAYPYPEKLFGLVDNHHMWRIFHSHGIPHGNAVKIFQSRLGKNKMEGPFKNSSMGVDNSTWEMIYEPADVDGFFWENLVRSLRDLNPSFLYTSPSVFVSMQEFLNERFDFPVIFSCETLTDSVRNDASKIFTKVIDKMRDWTTGFGFFECREGTRHVYDDLCLVSQIGEKKISSLDFFNYCRGSAELSDDRGTIAKRLCKCGIYGNILDSFEGKDFECLVSINGTRYSANYVSNQISGLKKQDLFIRGYQIVQDKNKNITVKTRDAMGDKDAMLLAKSISYLLLDRENKIASVENQEKRIHFGDGPTTIRICGEEPSLNKNKKISLRSFAI